MISNFARWVGDQGEFNGKVVIISNPKATIDHCFRQEKTIPSKVQ